MDDAVTGDDTVTEEYSVPPGAQRILMVSPFPPVRDGIASYALATVRALRRQGHDVEVLSPGPSAAQHHLDLVGPRGALALAKRIRGYDRVIVQFHPDFFYPDPAQARSRLAESLALAVPFGLARHLEVVVHEIDGRHGRPSRPDGQAARRLWGLVERITVHTESERAGFIRDFGVDPRRVGLVEHGADFTPHTRLDRAGARAALGLPADEQVFLTIGFIQPSKGFDRAVAAFEGLGAHGASLHVVGSVRVDDPGMRGHLADLRTRIAATEGATLHSGYLSDEAFDRWIVAADVVVLPYRNIWSSGVLERAALFDRPVIATRVGGLAEQAAGRTDVRLVDDDATLRTAMIEWLPAADAASTTSWPDDVREMTDGSAVALDGPAELQHWVQARVRSRAAARPSLDGRPRSAAVALARTSGAAATVAQANSAPLRRLSPLGPPDVGHARRPVRLVKRVLRRALAWQVDPLTHRVNELQAATVVALESAAVAAPPPDRVQP